MGGLLSLTAAGTFPDRIAATASYHGGRLATDDAESPHLLASKIKSRVYIEGAIEDSSFPNDMKQRLEDALTQAGVDHTIETYPAKHGWVFRDIPVYDASAAERHWQTMLALFDAKLVAGVDEWHCLGHNLVRLYTPPGPIQVGSSHLTISRGIFPEELRTMRNSVGRL